MTTKEYKKEITEKYMDLVGDSKDVFTRPVEFV